MYNEKSIVERKKSARRPQIYFGAFFSFPLNFVLAVFPISCARRARLEVDSKKKAKLIHQRSDSNESSVNVSCAIGDYVIKNISTLFALLIMTGYEYIKRLKGITWWLGDPLEVHRLGDSSSLRHWADFARAVEQFRMFSYFRVAIASSSSSFVSNIIADYDFLLLKLISCFK